MKSWQCLPAARLDAAGSLSARCLAEKLGDLRALGRHLATLPYGRPADRADWAGVLDAGHGTCSTKHAFLAATAAENRLPVHLTLGLYEMCEANTPGVGEALAATGLESIPEAHCYVSHEQDRVDVTRGSSAPTGAAITFLAEERITPHQIGDYKVTWHQQHLQTWCRQHDLDWEGVWKVREACIAALTRATPHRPNPRTA